MKINISGTHTHSTTVCESTDGAEDGTTTLHRKTGEVLLGSVTTTEVALIEFVS
jgi:hypothetical protein